MKLEKLIETPCSECGGNLERRVVAHEFEREGVRVRVSGIESLVCENCEAEYSLPGEAQKLVEAVNKLFLTIHNGWDK